MRTLRYWFWDTLCLLGNRMQRMYCWFVGHDECWGSAYDREPDYCGRCFMEWPQDDMGTLPKLLNRRYCWMVERQWRWFDWLDEWLQSHDWTFQRLSSWWEY